MLKATAENGTNEHTQVPKTILQYVHVWWNGSEWQRAFANILMSKVKSLVSCKGNFTHDPSWYVMILDDGTSEIITDNFTTKAIYVYE